MTDIAVPNTQSFHQYTNVELFRARWASSWSRHPDDAARGKSGVFLFRKTLQLDAVPAEPFIVHVSADQRYRLYVNGVSVAWGPARGDLLHWRYETLDLSPYLRAGENVLAAVVHYFAYEQAPLAQVSHEAVFIMQGNNDAESAVNTPDGWRVRQDHAYTFSLAEAASLHAYCVVGPSEQMDTTRHSYGWMAADFDATAWSEPVAVGRKAAPYGLSDSETSWLLVPRTIPAMEESAQVFGSVVAAEGVEAPPDWPANGEQLTIPAGKRAVLLFDHGVETCAFPEITVTGGAGASLRLAYAEALYVPGGGHWEKGNRNEIEGHEFRGYSDSWRLDGGTNRLLRPLWWKTFRYAQLTIQTGDTPVTIDSLVSIYTGYPFVERARFEAAEVPEAKAIWDIGWRTARLCAHESYMDCPYYEQLQYVGDTRIQCLISLYMSGDSRLFRNALAQIDNSRLPEGLTQSRYPARIIQVIPPFSLWYIGMVDDYRRHVPGDDDFLRGLLPGVRGVLEWFRARLREDGLLGPLQFWNFVDWCNEWNDSAPPGWATGGSSVLTLQYAIACANAADLFAALGVAGDSATEAAKWTNEARAARQAVRTLCFDAETSRLADTPERKTFSQHASILAVLADAIPAETFKPIMERVLTDSSQAKARFYFHFYLNRALVKAGLADRWLDTLGPWREMRALGLTTWAETPEPTRSDCHAWSAAPNYEFLATVLGIQPGAPGWSRVRIAPALGALTEASGEVPHPNGVIKVAYRRTGDTLTATLDLPDVRSDDGIVGELVWRGQSVPLKAGHQVVTVTAA